MTSLLSRSTLANYYLFLRMKTLLKGCRLQSTDMKESKMAACKVTRKGLQEYFQQWYGHWQKCVTSEKNYVKGGVCGT
jgi:hypothetical protein